jgi:TRAP transporter TAXI family solute receptor
MRIPGPILGVLIATTALLQPALCQGQPLPRSVTFATSPPGTVGYAVASGLAKLVNGAAPFQMAIQPYTGTSTYLPLLNNGEVEFGLVHAVDMALAYRGPARLKIGGRNPFPHAPNVRLVMRGSPLMVGLLVRKDSPIKTIHDIKGKRFTGEYPAHLAVWYNMFGHLSSAGLSWDDVKVVPVPAVNDGVDALVQGRADVTEHALNSAKVREADAAIGVRHLSTDCSREGEERLRKAVPGYYPRWIKPGEAAAVVEDTCVIAYDQYFLAHRGVPEQVVIEVLKAIWENIDKLPPLHPTFKELDPGASRADAGVTLPYHAGAVGFYKQREVWKPEMDQAQQRLLTLNP